MQVTYRKNLVRAIEGLTVGQRKGRPGHIPAIKQVDQGVIANSEAGDWVHTLIDLSTGQTRTMTTSVSGAVEATTLDELVAQWNASGGFANVASISEDGVDTYTVSYKNGNRAYELTSVPPGSMTDTITTPTPASANDMRFARFVARDALSDPLEGYNIRDLSDTIGGGDDISDIVGVLHRMDSNNFHQLEETRDFDVLQGGRTHAVSQFVRIWMKAYEESMPLNSSVWVRRVGGSGPGTIRATDPGGGAAIDISSICEVEQPAANVGDLVLVKVNLQP